MNLIEGDLKPEELAQYINTRPAARALYELKKYGVSSDTLLDESIIYYERLAIYQNEVLLKYIKKYGALL